MRRGDGVAATGREELEDVPLAWRQLRERPDRRGPLPSAVLLLEGSDEPISVRAVVQATFGGLGYLHEVLVVDGTNETSTVTGTCDYG